MDGLPPWKDRDFEKAFSIGTENDSHAGRQWRRLKDKSSKGGTTEDRLRMIKGLAEKNGWLPSTQLDITQKMIKEFLEILDLRFLDTLRWEICGAIGTFSDTLKQSDAHRLDLAELDVFYLDPDELILNENSSKEEIQDFILTQLDELSDNLSWMATKLRTPHW
ncbi:hypothetical protein [Burkholderia cepacia]|uniref:hypothetical protein n=1 Tax=Burkholderia cepacia TaxID=292 RepID=UPI0012D91568|nr:hypothetical protein [Burkholderia cepacia]